MLVGVDVPSVDPASEYTLGLDLLQVFNNLVWCLARQIIDDLLAITILGVGSSAMLGDPLAPRTRS